MQIKDPMSLAGANCTKMSTHIAFGKLACFKFKWFNGLRYERFFLDLKEPEAV